jgi:hypothetical protein
MKIKQLPEPSQIVLGMTHVEMLEIMRSADIFCSHDKFARILMDAQRRGFAERDKRELVGTDLTCEGDKQ